MQTLSLKELKVENGTNVEQENEEIETEEVQDVDSLELESEAEAEEKEVDESESDDDDTEAEDSEAVEEWLKSEEDERTLPLDKHIEVRTKLKTKLSEKDEELQTLKQEIESLKYGFSKQPVNAELKRPSRADFADEYDEVDQDAYDQAVDDWNLKRFEQSQSVNQNKALQEQQQEQQQQALEESVNKHYESATKLVKDGLVKAEAYQEADQAIVGRLNNELAGDGSRGHGRLMADHLANIVRQVAGDSSAKLWFKLGRNPNQLEKLVTAFRDPLTHAQGYAEIAKMSAEVKAPNKKRSLARPPAKQISGDKNASPSESSLKRKIKKARESGDLQSVISLKRQAKKQGVNVKDI